MIRVMSMTTFLSAALLASSVHAAEPLQLDNDSARLNYSLGYQIGGDFKRQGVEMDAAAVIKGIEDALSGAEPAADCRRSDTVYFECGRHRA